MSSRRKHDIKVLALHALAHMAERGFEACAERELAEHLLELDADRRLHLLGDQLHGLLKAESGPQRIGYHDERIAELIVKRLAAPRNMKLQIKNSTESARRHANEKHRQL